METAAEQFIKNHTGVDIDRNNRFDDCDLTWDKVISIMEDFRKDGRYYTQDEVVKIQELHYEMGFNAANSDL